MSTRSQIVSRFSITAILSDTFLPPRIATNGRFGRAIASARYFTSFSTRKPTTAALPSAFIATGTACMLASVRWQVPKASFT